MLMEPFAVLCVIAYGVAMAVIGYLTAVEDYPDDQEADDTGVGSASRHGVVGSLVAGGPLGSPTEHGSDDPGHH